jgi:dihydrodipicolinate synthase/N-acetylneuraminate lyase
MSANNPYREFVLRYLTRGAVGVSVGLAAVASAGAHQDRKAAEQSAARSFSERLDMLWRALPESDGTAEAIDAQQLAQGISRPPGVARPPFPNVQRVPHGKTHTKTFSNTERPRPFGKTHTKSFPKIRPG